LGIVVGSPGAEAGAPPSWWKANRDDRPGRLTLAGRASLSIVNFSRPDRACRGVSPPPASARRRLAATQAPGPTPFCPAESSDEVAVGFGLGLGFHVLGPLHLTWGADVAFTDPQVDVLAPQTMVTMPFGVLLTWREWPVRPLLEGTAVPFVLVPDGVKNVMFGGRAGIAVRIREVDLAVSLGYASADALRPWEVRVSVLHVP
jgi:hypothetical protein